MTEEQRIQRLSELNAKRARLQVRLQIVQDEINELTQQDYDDRRVYFTGERARDNRLDCVDARG